jgi:APA family basic amino acid/polyamine antiporter
MSFLRQFFAVQTVSTAPAGGGERLKRALGPLALTAIGLGATIGTGIFALTGTVAAEHSGPALTLSLLIALVPCTFAALCYSEFASFLPVSGSAYSYAYATIGEGLAWFIGWNLTLEYLLSASAVAVSWSGYVTNWLQTFGIHFPEHLINAPFTKTADGGVGLSGAIINVPAMLIVGVMSWVCYIGIKQSAGANTFMVLLKCGIIVIFVIAGLHFIDTANWHPYIPENTGKYGEFGWSGILKGAAIMVFSYIGFDTASTTALEANKPQRDVPLGILGALFISGLLYIAMAAVMTGMVSYTKLDVDEPVAVALDAHPEIAMLGFFVKIGAIIGMTSVILMSLLGQPRIMLAMADDGLLPKALQKCHPKYKTPHVATAITGVIAAIFAGIAPLDILGELISIGILLAFTVVCLGVLVLRYTRPDTPRPFRVPWAPVTCTLGAVMCVVLMFSLGVPTLVRLVIWTVVGFAIYGFYGYWNSRLHTESTASANRAAEPGA